MDSVASQEVRGGICAVNLEAFLRAAVLMGQAHVVEHRACIKQFGIESEAATLARQSAPVIGAARMVKEQLSRTSSVISRASLLSGILVPARSVFIVRSIFIARLLPIDLEYALFFSFNRHPPDAGRAKNCN